MESALIPTTPLHVSFGPFLGGKVDHDVYEEVKMMIKLTYDYHSSSMFSFDLNQGHPEAKPARSSIMDIPRPSWPT